MTVLDDLKKVRRTRWSRLMWSTDCPTLAANLGDIANATEGRAALVGMLSTVVERLASEASLIRYSHCAREVLSALLGLGDETPERSADERYERAGRIAGVPVSTLKTRDGNLLLDGFARALTAEWQLAGLGGRSRQPVQLTASRRRDLESLVRNALSELSPAFGDAAWLQGCQPILAIDDDPGLLRRDVSYTAGIEYRKLGGSYCYQVTSSFRSTRVLPTVEVVDVVFCRTTVALEQEFQKPATISVELCEFDHETWERLAAHEHATDLHVDAEHCPMTELVHEADRTRLRFTLPDLPTSALRVPVAIRNTYLVPASSRVYPIRLGSYFTIGPCEMTVTLIDPRAESLDAFVYFMPAATDPAANSGPAGPEVERFLTPEGARQQTVRVRSPGGTLLWPHSGADFVWRRR